MMIKTCVHCGLKDRPLYKDAAGYFCQRCGKVPDKPEDKQPKLPDLQGKIAAATEERVTDPDYVPPPPAVPEGDTTWEEQPDSAWEDEPEQNGEPKKMVKTVKKSVKKKSTKPAKKSSPPAAKAEKKGAAAKKATSGRDFLSGIDAILQGQLELQKKKLYGKMKTDEALDAEIDKHATNHGKDKHQGAAAYRTYYNGEAKGMGTTRKANDPVLVSRAQIDKWKEADKNPDVMIKEKTKKRNERRG